MEHLQAASQPGQVEEFFDELFRRYHQRVASWCARIMKNPEPRLDLAQEVFLRAYRYRHTFRADARVSTWLYRIARNHCLDTIRRLQSDPLGKSGELPPGLIDRWSDVEAGLEQTQRLESMWRLMDRTLTEIEKQVMALHYGEEIALETITRDLMLSNPSGAKAYIVNARRKLKRVLSDAPA